LCEKYSEVRVHSISATEGKPIDIMQKRLQNADPRQLEAIPRQSPATSAIITPYDEDLSTSTNVGTSPRTTDRQEKHVIA